jgi:hypothetical protein
MRNFPKPKIFFFHKNTIMNSMDYEHTKLYLPFSPRRDNNKQQQSHSLTTTEQFFFPFNNIQQQYENHSSNFIPISDLGGTVHSKLDRNQVETNG